MQPRFKNDNGLFSTVPKHDYLGLFAANDEAYKKVAEFLSFSKEDVAKVTGVSKASVRYDDRIPAELKQRLLEIGVVCNLVAGYFEGDLQKTALWFSIPNPALGDISPRDMLLFGRYQKLIKFISNALAGNNP